MIKRNIKNIVKLNFLSSIKLTAIIFKILPVFFIILYITGCYTILDPPPEYIYQEENHSTHDAVDSVIVTEKNINNYYCSSCEVYENSCSSIHWRYNSWTGTYYCDPYYYNYSYYNHHYNNNYWWHSSHDWRYNDYSHNHSYVSSNSYVPSKKTRRDRSFSRISDDSVVDNVSQNDTASSAVQSHGNSSHTENIQTDNSYSENTENSATSTDSQTIKTNTKPRRKHNRRAL